MSKVYIASSWKMEPLCKLVASELRKAGNEVDCFCDESTGRYVFHWSEFVDKEEDLMNYDAISFMGDSRTQRAFNEDKAHLDWADTVVLLLPSGRSAHLEAGYGVGQGKKLFIFGEFSKGEFDVMYGFAQSMFRLEEIQELIHAVTTSGPGGSGVFNKSLEAKDAPEEDDCPECGSPLGRCFCGKMWK